jgi:alcohol dehydrogenase
VQDFLPPSVDGSVVRTAIMTAKIYGRVVLMGASVCWGRRSGTSLSLGHAQPDHDQGTVDVSAGGCFGVGRPVRGGLLDLQHFDLAEFALEDVNEAVAHASANG